MSFIVIDDQGREVEVPDLIPYPLKAKSNVYIEALTAASIRHPGYLKACKHPVMLLGKQGVFLGHHVWVESSLVSEGSLVTFVFNMSSSQVRIPQGESVSHLLGLPSDYEAVKAIVQPSRIANFTSRG